MQITERFSATRDNNGWTLTETYTGRSKYGAEKTQTRKTYHATLGQVICHVIDKESGDMSDISDVVRLLDVVKTDIDDRLSAAVRAAACIAEERYDEASLHINYAVRGLEIDA